MWEEYAGKLEEQLRALVQDNQLLQGALQAVRTSLASGQPASPVSTGVPCFWSPAFQYTCMSLCMAYTPNIWFRICGSFAE